MAESILTLHNITKTFGEKTALNNVSLTLYKGEVVSLLGPNGAGKTTLSSIIVTLHPPTSGDIMFNNTSIYSDIITSKTNLAKQKKMMNCLVSFWLRLTSAIPPECGHDLAERTSFEVLEKRSDRASPSLKLPAVIGNLLL